jgi:hypothetical protein
MEQTISGHLYDYNYWANKRYLMVAGSLTENNSSANSMDIAGTASMLFSFI